MTKHTFAVIFTLLLWHSISMAMPSPRTLETMVDQALCCNKDLQAKAKNLQAACEKVHEKYGAFAPRISLETGAFQENLNVREDAYSYGYLEAQWNLFRGGHDVSQLETSRIQYLMAHHELEKAKKELSYEVAKEFYHLLHLSKAIDLVSQAVHANAQYADIASKKWNSGLTTEVDVIEFQLQKDQLDTEQVLLHKELVLHQIQLAQYLDCLQEAPHIMVVGDFPKLQILDISSLAHQAFCQRNDKELSSLEVHLRHAAYCSSRSELLPSVDMIAAYGKEPDSKEERGTGTKISLNISVPLFDGLSAYRRKRETCHKVREAVLADESLRNIIHAEVATAVNKLELLRCRLEAEERQEKIAERYWLLTKEEYSRGTKNSPDLASAIERLLHSRLQKVSLSKDYALAFVDLLSVTGAPLQELYNF